MGDDAGYISLLDTRVIGAVKRSSVLRLHKSMLYDMQFSLDDRSLLSCGLDKTAVSDIQRSRFTAVLAPASALGGVIKVAQFMPSNQNIIATGSIDGSLGIYDVRAGSRAVSIVDGAHGADSHSSSSGQPPAASSTQPACDKLKPLINLQGTHAPAHKTTAAAASGRGSGNARTSPASVAGAASQPRPRSGPAAAGRAYGPESSITAVCFADKYLISGGAGDGCVRFWDLRRMPGVNNTAAGAVSASSSIASRSASSSNGKPRKRAVSPSPPPSTASSATSGFDRHKGVSYGSDGSGAVYVIRDAAALCAGVGSSDEANDDGIEYESSSRHPASSKSRVPRAFGVSSVEVSPDVLYSSGYGASSSHSGPSMLVSYKSSRILLFDLNRILAGGGGFYGGSFLHSAVSVVASQMNDGNGAGSDGGFEMPSFVYHAAGYQHPSSGHASTAEGTGAGAAGASFTVGTPTRSSTGQAAFQTPNRSSVRSSKAWDGILQQSPSGPPSLSSYATDAASIKSDYSSWSHAIGRSSGGRQQQPVAALVGYSEFTGHYNPSFSIKAHFSRCGNYIISGSADCRAYIWKIPHKSRAFDMSRGAPHSWDPLYVLGTHRAEVGDIAWGGSPSHLLAAPDEHLRIATVSDDGGIRVWGPCLSDNPAGWLENGRKHRSASTESMRHVPGPHHLDRTAQVLGHAGWRCAPGDVTVTHAFGLDDVKWGYSPEGRWVAGGFPVHQKAWASLLSGDRNVAGGHGGRRSFRSQVQEEDDEDDINTDGGRYLPSNFSAADRTSASSTHIGSSGGGSDLLRAAALRQDRSALMALAAHEGLEPHPRDRGEDLRWAVPFPLFASDKATDIAVAEHQALFRAAGDTGTGGGAGPDQRLRRRHTPVRAAASSLVLPSVGSRLDDSNLVQGDTDDGIDDDTGERLFFAASSPLAGELDTIDTGSDQLAGREKRQRLDHDHDIGIDTEPAPRPSSSSPSACTTSAAAADADPGSAVVGLRLSSLSGLPSLFQYVQSPPALLRSPSSISNTGSKCALPCSRSAAELAGVDAEMRGSSPPATKRQLNTDGGIGSGDRSDAGDVEVADPLRSGSSSLQPSGSMPRRKPATKATTAIPVSAPKSSPHSFFSALSRGSSPFTTPTGSSMQERPSATAAIDDSVATLDTSTAGATAALEH